MVGGLRSAHPGLTNFAIHLPLIDWLFGTYHLPLDVWPERYGIEGNPVPSGYMAQLVHPLRSQHETR